MKNIFLNPNYLTTIGPNASFGNHVLHLMFCLNLSEHQNLKLKVPVDSNLDRVFDLNQYKENLPFDTSIIFSEKFSDNLEVYRIQDQSNLIESINLLNNKTINFPKNSCVEGWFYNVPLYPLKKIFNQLIIKEEVKNLVNAKYENIFKNDSISLHYRGTDFEHYYNTLAGDIRLKLSYYIECLDHMVIHYPWIKNVNIFTEDQSFLENFNTLKERFPKLNFLYINNEFHIDWLCLFYSKNIISSNSSFCSSASAYNKSIVYQPNKYMLKNTHHNFNFPTQPFFINSNII